MRLICAMSMLACAMSGMIARADELPMVYFQAHRGGLEEAPENTMAAVRHAWSIPGAVPEVDLRTSSDGRILCLHDATLARTTNASEPLRSTPVSKLTIEQIQSVDAGVTFGPEFMGERVPELDAVLLELTREPGRQIYLDIKDVTDSALQAAMEKHSCIEQVLFVHGNPVRCAELQELFPGSRTMTWISGTPDRIRQRYTEIRETGFRGISQLQFHLQTLENEGTIQYVLEPAFLAEAVASGRAKGVAIQVRPFDFDTQSLRKLVGLGIHWYVADAPERFYRALTGKAAE
ncbi:MAG: hypothetical protein AMXMBFR84_29780 [Candidatus Hydrogenedentota bacterium]